MEWRRVGWAGLFSVLLHFIVLSDSYYLRIFSGVLVGENGTKDPFEERLTPSLSRIEAVVIQSVPATATESPFPNGSGKIVPSRGGRQSRSPARKSWARAAPSSAAIDSDLSARSSFQMHNPSRDIANTPAVRTSVEGEDGDAFRRYRLALAVTAARLRMQGRWRQSYDANGTVDVVVEMQGNGALPLVVAAHSSGNAALDVAAVSLVGMALRIAPIPVELHGKDFSVELPVIFEAANPLRGEAADSQGTSDR